GHPGARPGVAPLDDDGGRDREAALLRPGPGERPAARDDDDIRRDDEGLLDRAGELALVDQVVQARRPGEDHACGDDRPMADEHAVKEARPGADEGAVL